MQQLTSGLESYVECIHQAVDRAPGPVVLVAHSRGGIAATQAAEGRHERISTLVYHVHEVADATNTATLNGPASASI